MALIGYARVSTEDQELDLQRDALRAAGVDKVFEDVASGARAERPGLAAALAYMRDGDVLVVWRLDRLGRNLEHLIATVRQVGELGSGFRSLTEGIDTTTPAGRLVFHLFGSLAEFERDLIRERTQAGLRAAAARGRKGGRRKAVTPEILKKARLLRARGLTVEEAARRLKIGRTTLYRELAQADEADQNGAA